MRHFTRDEWYINGYTWCGITRDGKTTYPMSWDYGGRVYGWTRDIQGCLNHGTIKRVRQQILAELKNDPFFFRYKQIYLVHIKEYPTFYFDYIQIAKQLKIKIDRHMDYDDIPTYLMKYGFEPISDNPKIIETYREDITHEYLDRH